MAALARIKANLQAVLCGAMATTEREPRHG